MIRVGDIYQLDFPKVWVVPFMFETKKEATAFSKLVADGEGVLRTLKVIK